MVYSKVKFWKSKKLYRVVPQMKGLDEHFLNQLTFWRYDVIRWRNNVKSFSKRNKTHLFIPCIDVCTNAGMWVNACPKGEPGSIHARMCGGLLQDTVSPIGDMVHFYLAKASFLQDMLLCLFVILQKLAFCKICYSVCLSVFLFFFLYVIIVFKYFPHTTSLTPI
jgi:hypothetical protein